MYQSDNKIAVKCKINEVILEKVFCSYCRNSIDVISNEDIENQICVSCQKIISKSELRQKDKLNLSQNEKNAIRLIEINHNINLPIITQMNVKNFNKKNKRGVIVEDNQVIGIYLDNYEFNSFPDEIFYFKNVKYISLMNTKLIKIPSKIYSLTNLKALDLRKNLIEFLPDSLTSLKNLKILTLTDNLLRLLPDTIGEMNLEHLDLENNLLYSIPDSFKELKHLKVLNLFDNQINLKLIIGKMPKQLIKCGIGGNSTKKSLRILKSIFKGNKCSIYLKRNKFWNKKLN